MDKYRFIKKSLEDCIELSTNKKYVVMSDLHLGVGDNSDNMVNNQRLLFAALDYYKKNNYTVILNGDIFELAENSSIEEIENAHSDIIWQFKELYEDSRLILIRGNHDKYLEESDLKTRMNPYTREDEDLFPGIHIYESFKIGKIIGLHGYQNKWQYSTCFNRVVNFLLRHVYKHFENWFWKDPTFDYTGYQSADSTEEFFDEYGKSVDKYICIGHTHAVKTDMDYCIDIGAGIMPRCVTCGEFDGSSDKLKVYKWWINYNPTDLSLFYERVEL